MIHIEHEGKSIVLSRWGSHTISAHRAASLVKSDAIPTILEVTGIQEVLIPTGRFIEYNNRMRNSWELCFDWASPALQEEDEAETARRLRESLWKEE